MKLGVQKCDFLTTITFENETKKVMVKTTNLAQLECYTDLRRKTELSNRAFMEMTSAFLPSSSSPFVVESKSSTPQL